uniref:Uncharacterized protein n=1 Tax=Arundo donax TaxID=35708 RepID=A0A0A9R8D2_ARUDO
MWMEQQEPVIEAMWMPLQEPRTEAMLRLVGLWICGVGH